MAALWPIFACLSIHAAAKSRVPVGARGLAVFAAALAILFFPCALGFLDFPARDELGSHLQPVCKWLRDHTPPNRDTENYSMRTTIDKGYSILTQWWQGTYILYGARRPVTATPYHTNIDAIADSYRFLVASNWAEAERILQKWRCRYVLIEDRRLFVDDAQRVLRDGRVWVEFSQRKAPDGKLKRAFRFTPLFYETMFYRLQMLEGGGMPLRLAYESAERSEYDRTQARFKVFEYLGTQF
jgi:hypothetical protein